jgi:hypothetical protein
MGSAVEARSRLRLLKRLLCVVERVINEETLIGAALTVEECEIDGMKRTNCELIERELFALVELCR